MVRSVTVRFLSEASDVTEVLGRALEFLEGKQRENKGVIDGILIR